MPSLATRADVGRPVPPRRRAVVAVGSSLLGLTLLTSVPIALAGNVGTPWPDRWPSTSQVMEGLRGGTVDVDLVVGGLAMIVWVAWARVAAAVVIEVVARLLRRPAPEARVLGGSQRMAAIIVTGAALLVSMLARVSPARGATVEVQPGDTLSGIAGRVYGDDRDWPLIFEANRGRELSGRVFEDPNLILPGWQLEVPEVVMSSPPSSPGPVDPAADDLGQPLTAVLPAAATAPTPTAPTPTTATPITATTAPATPTTGNPAPTGATCAASALPAVGDARVGGSRPGAPTGLAGAVLLAGGAITVLELRRRRAARSARPGSRLPSPDPALASTERVLRQLHGGERLARLDVVLRAAAALLRDRHRSVLGVLDRADGRLVLLLSGPVSPVPPFEAVEPDRWVLPGRIDLIDLAPAARTAAVACPALVHLGRGPDGEVYLDLEAVGTLSVDGPSDAAAAVVRGALAALAVSPFVGAATVVAVGEDPLLERPGLQRVSELDEAIELAAATIGGTAAATATGTTTFGLRGRTPDEAWEPVVIVVGPDATAGGALHELVELTTPPGRGLGAIVAGPVEGAGAALVSGERGWLLEPFGLPLTPVGVEPDDVAAVRRLLDGSSALPILDPAAVDEPPAIETEPDPAIIVRLLGPLRVEDRDGREISFEKGKALELVAWLALHRPTATRSGARGALWEVEIRDATFANVVSEARRSLARAVRPPDGEEWIARTLTEQLPLHPLVVTDAELVRNRLRRARRQATADAVETLRTALALIEGVPCDGVTSVWVDSEGHSSDLTTLATTVATELAERCISIGDVEGALAATAVGLRVLPGHEALVGLRMRARAASGDLAGVRAEWGAYERVVAADPWASGSPAPELVAVRRALLGGAVPELA